MLFWKRCPNHIWGNKILGVFTNIISPLKSPIPHFHHIHRRKPLRVTNPLLPELTRLCPLSTQTQAMGPETFRLLACCPSASLEESVVLTGLYTPFLRLRPLVLGSMLFIKWEEGPLLGRKQRSAARHTRS
jgi:hypothetical protein